MLLIHHNLLFSFFISFVHFIMYNMQMYLHCIFKDCFLFESLEIHVYTQTVSAQESKQMKVYFKRHPNNII